MGRVSKARSTITSAAAKPFPTSPTSVTIRSTTLVGVSSAPSVPLVRRWSWRIGASGPMASTGSITWGRIP